MPDEYVPRYKLTTLLLEKVTKTFGGGDIVAVTGNNGNALDIQRNNARDRAFANFPKTRSRRPSPGRMEPREIDGGDGGNAQPEQERRGRRRAER